MYAEMLLNKHTLFLSLAVTCSAPLHMFFSPSSVPCCAHLWVCIRVCLNALCVCSRRTTTPFLCVLTWPPRPPESGVLIRKSSHARSLAHCAPSAHTHTHTCTVCASHPAPSYTHIFQHGITYIPVSVVALVLAKPFPLCCVWFSLGFSKKWKT